jgi:hypothetical protein
MSTLANRCRRRKKKTVPVPELVPIPGLFRTGVDNSHAVLGIDEIDPHYRVYLVPSEITSDLTVCNPNEGDEANDLSSTWVKSASNPDQGFFSFLCQINLTGLNSSTASVSFAFSYSGIPNISYFLDGVYLNGVLMTEQYPQGFTPPYDVYNVTLNSGFIPGVNIVEFKVGNGSFQPVGLFRVHSVSGSAYTIP